MTKKQISISKTAQHQLMAMSPEQREAAMEALRKISEGELEGTPVSELLKSMPPENAERLKEHLTEVVLRSESEEEDPGVH